MDASLDQLLWAMSFQNNEPRRRPDAFSVLYPFRIVFGPPADAKHAFARAGIVWKQTSAMFVLRKHETSLPTKRWTKGARKDYVT